MGPISGPEPASRLILPLGDSSPRRRDPGEPRCAPPSTRFARKASARREGHDLHAVAARGGGEGARRAPVLGAVDDGVAGGAERGGGRLVGGRDRGGGGGGGGGGRLGEQEGGPRPAPRGPRRA